ncbi:sulfurtransferase complex subunit TusD [Pseudocolwellia sp. HL-MZ7]|uniref:sulfurtransferase complex subunit TusD n=1 Tax=Pseudocolwellia sp. HL-MZ7 TaxID=3400627 RepID=UPI003CFBA2E3
MRSLSVVITTPPSSYLTITAIDYINCAIDAGIDVVGVFFYQDGVLNASANISIPNDEYQTHKKWQTLNEKHAINLHVCITACEKRGLSDDLASEPNGQISLSNISQYFTVSGLGELVELTARADKVVQF